MPTFRGKPACDCLVAWLPAYEAELSARGILPAGSSLLIYQLIGGAAASSGTHSTGGAFDVKQVHPDMVRVARKMGADATWFRPTNWDGKGGIAHIHGVLTGCPHNGPARYQIDAVLDGLNGLANRGKDDGPRPLFMRSWFEGIAWHRAQNRRRKIASVIKSLKSRIRLLEAEREKLPKP